MIHKEKISRKHPQHPPLKSTIGFPGGSVVKKLLQGKRPSQLFLTHHLAAKAGSHLEPAGRWVRAPPAAADQLRKSESASLSAVFFVTPWTAARQAPLSMGVSRQEYWSGLPCPPPGDLPDPGIEPGSPALQANSLQTLGIFFNFLLSWVHVHVSASLSPQSILESLSAGPPPGGPHPHPLL